MKTKIALNKTQKVFFPVPALLAKIKRRRRLLAVSRCPAAGNGSFKTKCWAVRHFQKVSTEKAYLNALKVFDVCLELPSGSEKYFGFVFDEFCAYVHDTWNI